MFNVIKKKVKSKEYILLEEENKELINIFKYIDIFLLYGYYINICKQTNNIILANTISYNKVIVLLGFFSKFVIYENILGILNNKFFFNKLVNTIQYDYYLYIIYKHVYSLFFIINKFFKLYILKILSIFKKMTFSKLVC